VLKIPALQIRIRREVALRAWNRRRPGRIAGEPPRSYPVPRGRSHRRRRGTQPGDQDRRAGASARAETARL